MSHLLHARLAEIADPQLLELLDEIAKVKHLSLSGHQQSTLFNFLTITQRHSISHKPENILAAGCYQGCLLKKRVRDVTGESMGELALQLCKHFKVSEEFIDGKQYYVFLNQVMNPKSKLRRPQPFRLIV